jgi:hypothetical protein
MRHRKRRTAIIIGSAFLASVALGFGIGKAVATEPIKVPFVGGCFSTDGECTLLPLNSSTEADRISECKVQNGQWIYYDPNPNDTPPCDRPIAPPAD